MNAPVIRGEDEEFAIEQCPVVLPSSMETRCPKQSL